MTTYEYYKKWKKENPEKVKEKARKYYQKHKKEIMKKQNIRNRKKAEKRFNDNIEELASYIEKNNF